MSCPCCPAGEQFDAICAERDLKRFRGRGPDAPTRELLGAVQTHPLPANPTLIDVGGGVGVLHHILLEHGFGEATHVDASAAYLAVAAKEAERLGHTGRVRFHLGDFTTLAPAIPPADVVTLHRVVCCDPDYARMLGAAAGRARRLVVISYPRPRWITWLFVALFNATRRVLGSAFRVYVHPPARMSALLESAGLRRGWAGGTWIWAVELFERAT